VGAALHGGVVGDQHALAAGDASDAGHDAGARRLVVVAAVRRQRRELEEGRSGVEEAGDALARQELATGGVAAARFFWPAERGARAGRAQPSHGKVRVTGKAGMPSRRASGIALAIAIACSSEPTTAMGTTGVSVSSARRMKPWPNSCSW